MDRERMERMFCGKISMELRIFRYAVLEKEKEEIYASAYRIDCMIALYELLAEMSGALEEDVLAAASACPYLLDFLYDRWLQYQEMHLAGMQYWLDKELQKFRKRDGKERKEKTA